MGSMVSAIFQIGAGNLRGQQAEAQVLSSAQATRASSIPILGQASASEYNASIAQNNAQFTEAQFAEQERRYRLQASEEIAKTVTGYAASGIALSGSALNVISSNAANAELNALSIRNEGLVKAQAFKNASTLDLFQASQARSQAAHVQEQANYQERLAPLARDSAELSGYASAASALIPKGN